MKPQFKNLFSNGPSLLDYFFLSLLDAPNDPIRFMKNILSKDATIGYRSCYARHFICWC